MDNIRYVAIARIHDRVSVAEYCASDLPHLPASLLAQKLGKVLRSDRVTEHERLTITDREVGSIHYDSDADCLYLVVCSKGFQQRMAFKFLSEIRLRFHEKHGGDIAGAQAGGISRMARELLRGICMSFNNQAVDVADVSLQVEAAKEQMKTNIQSTLRNSASGETLGRQSNAMGKDGSNLNRGAGEVGKKMSWQSKKVTALMVVGTLILLAISIIPIVLSSRGGGSTVNGGKEK